MLKRRHCFLLISICVLVLTGCQKESWKGLSVLQNRVERVSKLCGRNLDDSFIICKKEMEKRLFVVKKEAANNPIFQDVEEVTIPDEEQIKTYLNMTISEIEKVTGNTLYEEENIIVFSFEDSYKGLYMDNSSFYFLCEDDKTIKKPVYLAFYGKYHKEYLEAVGLSSNINFEDIMSLWGETEIEESTKENKHYYRIRYERNGLLYSFVSENREGQPFNTFIELP